MDNYSERDAGAVGPAARFVPDRRYTGLAAAGFAVAVAVAVMSSDAPGRLLAGIAAVLLLGYVAADLIFSPRLTASPEGLQIRSPELQTSVPWQDVVSVRADVRARYGLRSTTLEVDIGHTVAVFSRRAIGVDPTEAVARINAFR